MSKDFYTLLEERLSSRLEEREHEKLLKQILTWYRDGGSKRMNGEIRDRVTLILQGLREDVE